MASRRALYVARLSSIGFFGPRRMLAAARWMAMKTPKSMLLLTLSKSFTISALPATNPTRHPAIENDFENE